MTSPSKAGGSARRSWLRQRRVDVDLAQDMTQDLLFRFWERRLPTYDPRHSFQAYLLKSARNLLAEVRRKRRPLVVPNDRMDEHADGGGPEAEAQWHELLERVERAVVRLPPDQEQVVRMVLDDRAPPEIAQALGLPLKRVYRLTFLARRRLEADLLQDRHGAAKAVAGYNSDRTTRP